MLSSRTYFQALRCATCRVWSREFLSLLVAAFYFLFFFPLVQCRVVCLGCVSESLLSMRKTHHTAKLVAWSYIDHGKWVA